jgi:hypothetical protein
VRTCCHCSRQAQPLLLANDNPNEKGTISNTWLPLLWSGTPRQCSQAVTPGVGWVDFPAGLASSSTGRNSRAEGPKFWKLLEGLQPADRDFKAQTGGVSTDSPAKLHWPAAGGPLGDSWSKMAKAIPPTGRNLQGELASTAFRLQQSKQPSYSVVTILLQTSHQIGPPSSHLPTHLPTS